MQLSSLLETLAQWAFWENLPKIFFDTPKSGVSKAKKGFRDSKKIHNVKKGQCLGHSVKRNIMHFQTEDFEIFDARDLLNVTAYFVMSIGKIKFP